MYNVYVWCVYSVYVWCGAYVYVVYYGLYMWYGVCVHVGGVYVCTWCVGVWVCKRACVCTRACVTYIYGPAAAAARGEDIKHRRIFLHLEAQVTEAGSRLDPLHRALL